VLIAVCDGLKGLPEAITTTWDRTVVQQCIVHLIRNPQSAIRNPQQLPLRQPSASRPDRQGPQAAVHRPVGAGGQGPVHRVRPSLGRQVSGDREAVGGNARAEFVPFLEYDVEIRRVICTTNAIKSINARYRQAVNARGPFPNEAAAMSASTRPPAPLTPPATAGHAGSSGGSPP
jgi:transposase-like protein